MTIPLEDIDILSGEDYVELELEGKTLKVSRDAEIRVKRDDEEMTVYADELQPEDDIIFDNKDLIWTLNEIQ